MHRMSHFVGQCTHILILPVIVEQHVRMHIIPAVVAVRTRALSFGWIHIDPPLIEGSLDTR